MSSVRIVSFGDKLLGRDCSFLLFCLEITKSLPAVLQSRLDIPPEIHICYQAVPLQVSWLGTTHKINEANGFQLHYGINDDIAGMEIIGDSQKNVTGHS